MNTLDRLRLLNLFALLLLGQFAYADEEYREFTSTDGNKIEATIVDAEADKHVTIRRRDGMVFKEVSLSRFSTADQNYVRKWVKAKEEAINNADLDSKSRISILFMRGKDDSMNNYGDIDDRIVNFEPRVTVTSDELIKTYSDVKGTIVVVGCGKVDTSTYVILSKEDFKMSIPPNTKTEWVGTPFTCRYDPDYGGYDYAGYLVVLRNKSGNIVHYKGSKSSWESYPEKLIKAETLKGYDRNFEKSTTMFNLFGLPGQY